MVSTPSLDAPRSAATDASRAPPRYRQLARTLIAEIGSGRYPVGGKLPVEHALCREFGASRHTVRSAIEELVRLGLVRRAPRTGTVVSASRPASRYRMAISDVSDLLNFATQTRLTVLQAAPELVTADCDDALLPHVGECWLHVTGVRHEPGALQPNCHHEVWIAPDFRGVEGVRGELHRPIFDLVCEQFGVTIDSVDQETRATTMPAVSARLLGVRPRSAALWVRRRYVDPRGRLIEVSINLHPADAFTYQLTIQRDASR